MLFPDALYAMNLAAGILVNRACCCYNTIQNEKEYRIEHYASPANRKFRENDANELHRYGDTKSNHQNQVRKYNESVTERMQELQKRNRVLKRDELVKVYNEDFKKNLILNSDEMNRSYHDSQLQQLHQQKQEQQLRHQSSNALHTRITTKRTRTITPRTNNCCSRDRSSVKTDRENNIDASHPTIEVLAEDFSVHDVFASSTDVCYSRDRAPAKTKITIVDNSCNFSDFGAPKATLELDHATMMTIGPSLPSVVRDKKMIDSLRVRRRAYRSLRKKTTQGPVTLSLLDHSDDESVAVSEDSMEEIRIE